MYCFIVNFFCVIDRLFKFVLGCVFSKFVNVFLIDLWFVLVFWVLFIGVMVLIMIFIILYVVFFDRMVGLSVLFFLE